LAGDFFAGAFFAGAFLVVDRFAGAFFVPPAFVARVDLAGLGPPAVIVVISRTE
jgi:hypothetical protein